MKMVTNAVDSKIFLGHYINIFVVNLLKSTYCGSNLIHGFQRRVVWRSE